MKQEQSRRPLRRADRARLERVMKEFGITHDDVLTTLLVITLLALLIGIACQLPPPPSSPPPDIFTVVTYSTLINDVQAGHVMGVNIEGNTLNGLLVPEPGYTSAVDAATRATNAQAGVTHGDDTAFTDCLPSVSEGCIDEGGNPRFPRSRIIYTLVIEQHLPSLLALLLKKQVVVSISRPYTPPLWVNRLWRIAPLWLLFLLILGTDSLKRRG